MKDASTDKPRRFWLATIDPVVKILVVLPPLLIVVVSQDITTPAVFGFVAFMGLASGASIRIRSALLATLMIIILSLWNALFFALVARTNLVGNTPETNIGFLHIHMSAWEVGIATSVRMLSIIVITLLGAIETKPDELTASLVKHCRVPYRFAYGAATAHRFINAYRAELSVLLAAQRARGIASEPGPFGYLRRVRRYFVPLLAGGARHASRLGLSMDARGFGAYPRRTFRHVPTIGRGELLYLASAWAITTAILLASFEWHLFQ